MNINQEIFELLHRHNCVVIPGFGAFILNKVSSKHDIITGKFSPPLNKVSFNINLKTNDGLLAKSLSENHGCSYDKALSAIDKYTISLRDQLRKANRYEIPKVGVFTEAVIGQLFFKPTEKDTFLPESFYLPTFHFPKLKPKETEIVSNPVIRGKETVRKKMAEPIRPKTRFKKGLKYAYISGVIAVVAVLLVSEFSGISNSKFQLSKLVPGFNSSVFSPRTSELTEILPNPEPYGDYSLVTEETDLLYLFDKNEGKYNADEGLKMMLVPETEVRNNTAVHMNYHTQVYVIMGCFEYFENAQKFVGQMLEKGLKVSVIEQKNGLFRVGKGYDNNKGEARKELELLRANHPDAWILSRSI